MKIEEIPPTRLEEYAAIPIAFEVRSMLRVEAVDSGFGGLRMVEQVVDPPYLKDYDIPGEDGPLTWAGQFDLANWGFLLAQQDGQPLGAAAIAYATPQVYMLEQRQDLAVLWDIRVHPLARGTGVGRSLFRAAVDWARKRNCQLLKCETQNINVPACRFYASQGCELGAIHRYAYYGNPLAGHETMLLWYLDLSRDDA